MSRLFDAANVFLTYAGSLLMLRTVYLIFRCLGFLLAYSQDHPLLTRVASSMSWALYFLTSHYGARLRMLMGKLFLYFFVGFPG